MTPTREELISACRHAREALAEVGADPVTQGKLARLIAAWDAQQCQTCRGRGVVGGNAGQTAEAFEHVTEPCPDCAQQIDVIEARVFDPTREHKYRSRDGQALVTLTVAELRGLIELARQALAGQEGSRADG